MGVEHDGDGRQLLANGLVDLALLGLALVVVVDLTGILKGLVNLGIVVLGVVVLCGAEEVGVQEVVQRRVVGNPAEAADLELAVAQGRQVGSPLHGGDLHLEAHSLQVLLNHGHDVLVTAAGVAREGDLRAGEVVVVDDLLRSLGVILAVLPGVVLAGVQNRGEEVVGRLTGTLEEAVADLLTIDGQGDCLTHGELAHDRVFHVHDKVVDGGLSASEDLLARRDGVAVLGDTLGGLELLQTARGDLGEVHVAGLELAECGVGVLLDGEVHAIQRGLLAVVVIEADNVDVLVGLPLPIHLEGAVADGGHEEALGVVEGGLRHGCQRGVGADVGEVGHGGGQLDDEGVLVGAGQTDDLVSLALAHLDCALDGVQVVANLAGGGHLLVHQTLPATLEGLGVNGVAVVELGALDQVEGVGQAVIRDVPGLGGLGDDLARLPVVVGQGVEEHVLDLGALILLGVVRIDGDRVVDVLLEGATSRGSGTGSAGRTRVRGGGLLLAASRQSGQRAGSKPTLHEGATRNLICHVFSLSHRRLPQDGRTLYNSDFPTLHQICIFPAIKSRVSLSGNGSVPAS